MWLVLGVNRCRGGWLPGHGPDAVFPLSGLRKSPTKGAIANKDCSFSNLPPPPRAPSGTRGRSYKSSALHAPSCNLSFTLSFNFAIMLWPRHRHLAGTLPEGTVCLQKTFKKHGKLKSRLLFIKCLFTITLKAILNGTAFC
ncbi:hypothetical protein GGTG_05166 [Gaeumannomyces tritici R3-111a-1]|uniref:Uncharacterized protein n=1 Tax=Gaeumannomyces tritici (strain R3-111a-1) TaxID=644352 RepID=J3NV53_GAET3|nr:hypothetical protein GGTG_05166 [Gaeumannomyces tritici R3-111a-1]EJT75229.1 hypothetical protein GGTG_05166 [Gaeumannomyces tritici R3-111a-1]